MDTPTTALMIRRDDQPAHMQAQTVGPYPNALVRTITPLVSILIRAGRAFIHSLLAGATAEQGGQLLGIDALQMLNIRTVFIVAVCAAIYSALQNTGELLAKLDEKWPLLRA